MDRRGFSLVETVAAVAVLAVGPERAIRRPPVPLSNWISDAVAGRSR